MKTIKEVTNNTAILRFVEHNNKKFRLTYDNRNGTTLGFDLRRRISNCKYLIIVVSNYLKS